MKNIIKNPIFTFVIGIVIASSSVVIASNLISSQIGYTPKDSSWGVNNVEAAIDSLYISKISNNYSTEEKVVGTWIDGKPLYQKTIEGTNFSSNSSGWAKIFEDNGIYIRNVFGYASDLDTASELSMPFGTYIPGDLGFVALIDYNHSSLSLRIFRSNDRFNYILTIQYTKTTD